MNQIKVSVDTIKALIELTTTFRDESYGQERYCDGLIDAYKTILKLGGIER